MTVRWFSIVAATLVALIINILPVAAKDVSVYEKTVSETLDLWRDGHYERLYENLSSRGKVSREQFIDLLRSTSTRPACCFQKVQHFKLLDEKRSSARVYARIGMEGSPAHGESSTREFKLKKEGGAWRMQMNDILQLAGVKGKRKKRIHFKSF